MKQVDKIISTISFEEANQIIKFQDIYKIMSGNPNDKFAIVLKKKLILLVGLFLLLIAVIIYVQSNNDPSISTISKIIASFSELIIIALMLFFFLKTSAKFLEYYSYKNFCYMFEKLIYISYFCAGLGMDNGNYLTTIIPIFLCLVVFISLYYKIEKNIVMDEINKLFKREYKTSTLLTTMLKLSGVVVVVIIVGMQLYRLNKSWLKGFIENSDVLNTNATISDIVGIFIGIPLLMIITLIPTFFLFDANLYMKGKIIKQYSEEFRQEYDFTKEEWYGD